MGVPLQAVQDAVGTRALTQPACMTGPARPGVSIPPTGCGSSDCARPLPLLHDEGRQRDREGVVRAEPRRRPARQRETPDRV